MLYFVPYIYHLANKPSQHRPQSINIIALLREATLFISAPNFRHLWPHKKPHAPSLSPNFLPANSRKYILTITGYTQNLLWKRCSTAYKTAGSYSISSIQHYINTFGCEAKSGDASRLGVYTLCSLNLSSTQINV